MNKLMVRILGVTSVVAFVASVAAAKGPEARPSDGRDDGASTLSCTKSGNTCGSSGQCCSHSCKIPHGRVVGRCN